MLASFLRAKTPARVHPQNPYPATQPPHMNPSILPTKMTRAARERAMGARAFEEGACSDDVLSAGLAEEYFLLSLGCTDCDPLTAHTFHW